MNYTKNAIEIVEALGGIENINTLTHCVTRLRFNLKNKDLIDKDRIDCLDGVATSVFSGSQYQVVVGQDVENLYDAILNSFDISDGLEPNSKSVKNSNSFSSLIDGLFATLSSIFTPLIPAMQGMGFLKVILVIWGMVGSTEGSSTYYLLNTLADSFFYFLPLLVAYSSANVFKANKVLALMIIGFLIHPNFSNVFVEFTNVKLFGITVPEANYVGTILPAILSVLLLSYVQKFLNKYLPSLLKTVFSSVLTLLIVAPISVLVIGPIGNGGSAILVNFFNRLYEISPVISGFVLGGLWQIIIIVGMHWLILTLIQFPNIDVLGVDKVTVAFAPSILAQVAAGFAVWLRVRDKNVKANVFSLTLTSLLSGGVIEPVMYGVNIKYRKPFYFVLLGGAVGGAITGAAGAGITAPVMFGIYTLPAFFGPGFWGLMLGTGVACLITFFLTYFFGVDESIEEAHAKELVKMEIA